MYSRSSVSFRVASTLIFAVCASCSSGDDEQEGDGGGKMTVDDDTATADDDGPANGDGTYGDAAQDDDNENGGGDTGGDVTSPALPELSIVTLNILHGVLDEDLEAPRYDRIFERLQLITDEMASRRPAIIILQEVTTLGFSNYPDVIGTFLRKLNADDAATPYVGVFGSVAGSPPLINAGNGMGQLTLSQLPFDGDPSNTEVHPERCVVHERLQTALGLVDVYNAHLDGDSGDPEMAEMRATLDFVEATRAADSIVILAGDLNYEPDEAPVQLLRDAGFTDLGEEAGMVCTKEDNSGCTDSALPLNQPGNRTFQRIDYVWVRSPRPLEHEIKILFDDARKLDDETYLWPSDHRGLAATLRAQE